MVPPYSLLVMAVFVNLFTSITALQHPNDKQPIPMSNTDDIDGVIVAEKEDQQWLYSNFPTVDASVVSERCASDTRVQIAALHHQLSWALQSIKLLLKVINYNN
jgi:hypothetical protein